MLKRIEEQVWYCCPHCGQKLLKVMGWDTHCSGLSGICKKCKQEYEISVDRKELETLMTEEERIKEDKKFLIDCLANNLTIDQLEWLLALERKFSRTNSLGRCAGGMANGKRQAN